MAAAAAVAAATAAAVAMMRVTAACVATSMLQVDRDIGIPSTSAGRSRKRTSRFDRSAGAPTAFALIVSPRQF